MKRSTPLKRSGSIPRKTHIKPVSSRRRASMMIYLEAREQFLRDNPICQMPDCGCASQDVHHKHGRLHENYLNRDTWAALCRACHDHIHRNPKWARANGWLK
jgi:hypothetical protein